MRDEATFAVKSGLAEMLKGGVIMDVVTSDQALVAEEAGAAAVMALERVPADIRRDGGVARMSDPEMIAGIQEAVSIPVMAKARIGHFVEAQVLEVLEVDYIDESEVLTPADETHHIDKWAFKVPFVCGATNLGEALRRIGEGAAMIRSKGEAGTGDIVEAVRHMRRITGEIRRLATLGGDEAAAAAKDLGAPLDLVRDVAEHHQVRGPAGAGPRDRRGDDALAGPGARRAGIARSRHADGQPGELQARGRAAPRPARLVARLTWVRR
jgi:pyridoxal 5'-phosphate synthase pdxS subunit